MKLNDWTMVIVLGAVVLFFLFAFSGCSKKIIIEQSIIMVTQPTTMVDEITLDTVYFDFDKSNVKEYWKGSLFINYLKIRDNDLSILIEGHTDSIGSDSYNYDLGFRRALSVRDYLVNLGIEEGKIQVDTLGETTLISDKHDLNRRASFTIIGG